MTWAERVNEAWDAWNHWTFIPGRFRMDRALKAAGVRDLVIAAQRNTEAVAWLIKLADRGPGEDATAETIKDWDEALDWLRHNVRSEGAV